MKNLIFLFVFLAGGLWCETTFAQVTFKVNISSQPIWGPVGYDHVEYYYLPDIESYYYVPGHKFIYVENGRWISRSYLPQRHRDYDMYHTRIIVVNEPRPYMRHQHYKERYLSNERPNYQSIRDSREPRYFENKNHPEHSKWKESKKNNIHHKGQENRGRSK